MLVNEYMVPCEVLLETKAADSEGGQATVWAPGAAFNAAITPNNNVERVLAERQELTVYYDVLTDKPDALDYFTVFRRQTDGRTFRVTSRGPDLVTPASASFAFSKFTAEGWDLP